MLSSCFVRRKEEAVLELRSAESESANGERRATISACLIVRDEEEALPEALASAGFCDEIVVVDSGSTDDTRGTARRMGAIVIENPWPGFAAQRNLALERARSEWIIELDADERVTAELRLALESFLASAASSDYEIAAMPIRQVFLGRELGASARYPDYRHRVFRRGSYRHDETRTVHEGLTPTGPVWILEGDLRHLLASSLRAAAQDAVRYARLDAQQIAAGRSLVAVLFRVFLRPPAKLLARLLVFGGWRDGWRGWLKIWLDCTTDALVWLDYLRGVRGLGSSGTGHFGRELPQGAPRLVGLAGRGEGERALVWLQNAQAAGTDVSLVTSGRSSRDNDLASPRRRAIRRLGPLGTIRALDAEWQVRPYDALVAFGLRSRTASRAIPKRLRGPVGLIDAERVDTGEALKALARVRKRRQAR